MMELNLLKRLMAVDSTTNTAKEADMAKELYEVIGADPWFQEHPELLNAFIPISMIPASHLLASPHLMKMIGLRNEENGLMKFIKATVRKRERVLQSKSMR